MWEGGKYISPSELVELAGRYGCSGTSISFNEPTLLLEYSLDVFKLAKQKGYYNTYITNGYMTLEALKALIDHGLGAMNIDIKGDVKAVEKFCHADVEKIWRNASWAREHGVWVEVTTLIIPGVNDGEGCLRGIARRIKTELGDETSWHTTGYYPAYKFEETSTPKSTLERARKIGREEGLKYVYVGNVPGHPYENTYCPKCNKLLVERYGFEITRHQVMDGCCPTCGEKIPIIGGLN
jgi:pyruvate formate lyase activating enzyme